MRRLFVAAVVLSIMVLGVPPASAHSFDTHLQIAYPGFNGWRWSFFTRHTIELCLSVGDSTPCSANTDFRTVSQAQIRFGGTWYTLSSPPATSTRTYPAYSSTARTKFVVCSADNVGHTYTLRTLGRGGLKHGGVWYYTPWYHSAARTETCTSSPSSLGTDEVWLDTRNLTSAPPSTQATDVSRNWDF